MKKVIAAILSSALVIAICLTMAACSTSIVGTWKFDSMHMVQGGLTVDVKAGESYGGVTINADAVVLEIKDDNTCTLKSSLGEEVTIDGTWEQKDGKYYLTFEGESQEVKLDGNKLTFENEGATVTLVK